MSFRFSFLLSAFALYFVIPHPDLFYTLLLGLKYQTCLFPLPTIYSNFQTFRKIESWLGHDERPGLASNQFCVFRNITIFLNLLHLKKKKRVRKILILSQVVGRKKWCDVIYLSPKEASGQWPGKQWKMSTQLASCSVTWCCLHCCLERGPNCPPWHPKFSKFGRGDRDAEHM